MKEKQIKVLKVEPGKLPKVVELKNELPALQEAVSEGAAERGLIEIVRLDENTCLLLNEEASSLVFSRIADLGGIFSAVYSMLSVRTRMVTFAHWMKEDWQNMLSGS